MASAHIKMAQKGKIILIGGAENKGTKKDSQKYPDDFKSAGILKRILDESKNSIKSRIEIIATASLDITLAGDYVNAFGRLKAKNIDVLPIRNRDQASDPEFLKRLESCDIAFFTGGDQLKLTSILGGTAFLDVLKAKLEKDHFIVAGSSAGAAAASESMIIDGDVKGTIRRGEVKTTHGFALLNNIVVDTHLIGRARIGRLFEIVVNNPVVLGVGLEENTGIIVTRSKMEAIGTGVVILADGRFIHDTNLTVIDDGSPISIDNMIVHVMSDGDLYDFRSRKLTIKK